MKTIIQTIEQYQMLMPGDAVVVGLSGGADSVMLVHVLLSFGAKVTAVHLNHMLRGEESMRDECFVKTFCEAHHIPCVIYREDVSAIAKEHGMSVEQAGRELRYRYFSVEAKKRNAKIATAHTLSDQAETILFRLARGSGMKGLCGIPPVRKTADGIVVIRPLIAVSREQVEQYCQNNKLSYVIDSSNLSDDYARNLIRHRVIPVLCEINSSAEEHLGQTAEILKLEETYLMQEAQTAYTKCVAEKGLCVQNLLTLHPAMQLRVLKLFLECRGMESDHRTVEHLQTLAHKQKRKEPDKRYGMVSLSGGKECYLRSGIMYITQQEINKPFPGVLNLSQTREYEMPSGKVWKFFISDTKPFQKIHKNLYLFCLDYAKIKGVLCCRGRMPGDQLRISSRNVTKTVKKWMNEAGIPVESRNKIFILCDEEGVVMVEGLGVAARAAVDENTQQFLIIEAQDCAEQKMNGVTNNEYDG